MDRQQILSDPRFRRVYQLLVLRLEKVLDGTLSLVQLFLELPILVRRWRWVVQRADRRLDGGGEHPVQGVVILHGDGVELVVVTARASGREAQQPAAGYVDPVVENIVLVVHEATPDGNKPQRTQGPAFVAR